MTSLPWEQYYFNLVKVIAEKSKDPNTKVGCLIVDPTSHRILATGYNGFPAGIPETIERWTRPVKYDYVVHAEANAIASAARFGIQLQGSTIFVSLFPCIECTKLIVSAGIKEVIACSKPIGDIKDRSWVTHIATAETILEEAGIKTSIYK